MPRIGETEYGHRFPGFDVLAQHGHWDAVTTAVVEARLVAPSGPSAFDDHEHETARTLVAMLLDVHRTMAELLTSQIGDRLRRGETDGWHYIDLPEDLVAWHRSLAGLNHEAWLRAGTRFAELDDHHRHRIVQGVQNAGTATWHGLPASKLWNLWLRYASTAYYAHPDAWDEIGFGGPAYPRGYKNAHVDGREPFEVKDAGPVIHLTPLDRREKRAQP